MKEEEIRIKREVDNGEVRKGRRKRKEEEREEK